MNKSSDRRVAEARNEVRQVRDWLLRPSAETMTACAPAVERAIAHLHELSACVQSMDSQPGLVQAIQTLDHEIQSVQVLLGAAGKLYFGRMRRLAMPDPDPASSPQPAQSVSVMG